MTGRWLHGHHEADGTTIWPSCASRATKIGKAWLTPGWHHFGVLVENIDERQEGGRKRSAVTHYMDQEQPGPHRRFRGQALRSEGCCSTSPSIPGPAARRCPRRSRKPPSSVLNCHGRAGPAIHEFSGRLRDPVPSRGFANPTRPNWRHSARWPLDEVAARARRGRAIRVEKVSSAESAWLDPDLAAASGISGQASFPRAARGSFRRGPCSG